MSAQNPQISQAQVERVHRVIHCRTASTTRVLTSGAASTAVRTGASITNTAGIRVSPSPARLGKPRVPVAAAAVQQQAVTP